MKITKRAFCLVQSLSKENRKSLVSIIQNQSKIKKVVKGKELLIYLETNTITTKSKIAEHVTEIGFKNNKEFRKTCEYLIGAIENLLVLSQLKNEPLIKQSILYKEFERRGLNQYKNALKQSIENNTRIEMLNNCTTEQYKSYASLYESFYSIKGLTEEKAQEYLLMREKCINTSYWITKLRILIDKAIRVIVFNIEDLPQIPVSILEICFPNNLLYIYVRIYKFAFEPFHLIDLLQVLSHIKKHAQDILFDDGERIFNFLTEIAGYYIKNKSTNVVYKDLYELHKIGLENKWSVQKDGFMYLEDFFNILKLSWDGNDLSFLEKVSSGEYEKETAGEHRIVVFMFAQSYIYFLKKEWGKILEMLEINKEKKEILKVEKTHSRHFIINRNVLKIKTLFHILLEEIDREGKDAEPQDILQHLRNHNIFIQRNFKLKSESVKINDNFCKFLKKFYGYIFKYKEGIQKDLLNWSTDLESTSSIEKKWLRNIAKILKEKSKMYNKNL